MEVKRERLRRGPRDRPADSVTVWSTRFWIPQPRSDLLIGAARTLIQKTLNEPFDTPRKWDSAISKPIST